MNVDHVHCFEFFSRIVWKSAATTFLWCSAYCEQLHRTFSRGLAIPNAYTLRIDVDLLGKLPDFCVMSSSGLIKTFHRSIILQLFVICTWDIGMLQLPLDFPLSFSALYFSFAFYSCCCANSLVLIYPMKGSVKNARRHVRLHCLHFC